MGSSKKVTVGYWYKLGWQVVLCQGGADAITKIEYADRTAWSGNASTNQTVSIDKPNLLGGDKREGGWIGDVDFMFGGDTQDVNPYLAYHANRPRLPGYSTYDDRGGVYAWIAEIAGNLFNEKLVADGGIPVPAYRGLVSLVFKKFTFAAMNPYLKEMSVTIRRVPKTLNTTHATIILDGRYNANAAHMIYEVLTNRVWGLGFNTGDVTTASFTAAAQTLYNEGFGLSMAWTNESTAEDFINLVLSHIGAVLYPAPDTGQYTLKLIRNDYVAASALLLDGSNILKLRSFQRVAPTDLTNEVTVQYRDPLQDKEAKVTVQNLAAIRSVGRIVRRVIEMPGIRNGALAARVAQRELQTLSTPLAKAALEVNLTAWNLRPGDVFRLSWPKLGINQLIMRVLDVEYGDLRNGRILINAIEDQFGLPSASYVATVPPQWVELPAGLTDITGYKILELPYYVIIRNQGEDYAASLADNRNFTGTLASRSNGLWTGYELHENIGGGVYEFRSSGSFVSWVGVTNAVTRLPTDNVWSYNTFFGDDDVEVDDVGVIDDEWVQVTAIDTNLKTITVERGVLDTIPATHSAGARLWLIGVNLLEDFVVQRLAGETVTYKLLPESGEGILPIGSATSHALTLVGRQERPYPPGNVRINTEYFPTQVVDDVVLAWVHRDRTIQTADPIAWSAAGVTLEAGVTYTAQYYRHGDNTLLHQQTGITAATKTVGEAEIGAESDLRIELFTVKGALNSYQKFVHTMTRITTTDPYSLRVFADSPLGFWRMSESTGSTQIKDASGNARDGTANSLTFGADSLPAPGGLNKAIDFNGGSSYVGVLYVAALAPTVALTVELWAKFDSFATAPATTQPLISKTQNGGYSVGYDPTAGDFHFSVYRNGAYGRASFPRVGNLGTGVIYHIIATYDGRYARIYVDGVLMATDDAGATYPIQYSVNNALIIGREAGAGTGPEATPGFDGVMDEVSLYGAAIPASEILARYKVGKNVLTYREDPFWDKTVLLLHMNGADASTTFTDVKGETITPNGNAQIDTAQSKFGGASALLDGNGDYLSVAAHADFVLNAGDLTVECYVRFASWSLSPHIFNFGSALNNRIALYRNTTTGFLTVHLNAQGITTDVSSNTALTAGVWYHVAVTRRGNTFRVFIDGVLKNTVVMSTAFLSGSCSLAVGWQHYSALTADYVNGWIDEFRITRACRYTKNFDVPVEAFPEQNAVAETVDPFFSPVNVTLAARTLVHFDGTNGSTAATDVMNASSISLSNGAALSTAQFKFGTASVLFDGVNDVVSVNTMPSFTDDFTLEFWINPSSLSGTITLFDSRNPITSTAGIAIRLAASNVDVLNGSTTLMSAAHGLATGTWYHIALVRFSGRLAIYIDGVLIASATFTNAVTQAAGAALGRNLAAASDFFSGYIDEFRMVLGAVYTAAFTPPAAQLVESPITVTDSKSTVLLLHMDGTNGSTTFTDQKGKTVTAFGNAQISTAQSKFGGASALFDGTGDYLSVADSGDLSVTGDFTFECWVRPSAIGTIRAVVSKYTPASSGWTLQIGASGLVSLHFAISGAYQTATAITPLTAGNWTHLAATKKGAVVRLFIAGVLERTVTLTGTVVDSTAALTVGRDPSDLARDWNGHIDDLRITKGVARYTDSFAPPKLPYPNA